MVEFSDHIVFGNIRHVLVNEYHRWEVFLKSCISLQFYTTRGILFKDAMPVSFRSNLNGKEENRPKTFCMHLDTSESSLKIKVLGQSTLESR